LDGEELEVVAVEEGMIGHLGRMKAVEVAVVPIPILF
jgi:hypothetical protein